MVKELFQDMLVYMRANRQVEVFCADDPSHRMIRWCAEDSSKEWTITLTELQREIERDREENPPGCLKMLASAQGRRQATSILATVADEPEATFTGEDQAFREFVGEPPPPPPPAPIRNRFAIIDDDF